ncbi:MAG: HAD hydrolase-like protein [Deltaproteobacteria bacterium]|nr:HAD hydrolase-like protein [Deltaproteobacteria bacterium]
MSASPKSHFIVLFDIDGTLIHSGGAGREAMERALRELTGKDDCCNFAFNGLTDRLIVGQALAAAGKAADPPAIDAALQRYLNYLPQALQKAKTYRVFDAAVELAQRLRAQQHIAVGLGTGNIAAGARLKLARGNIEQHFAFGGFGDDGIARADVLQRGAERGLAALGIAPGQAQVVVIGDTTRDVAAACEIGAASIAVLTSGADPQALAESGATLVVDQLDDPRVDALFAD